jgi:hypothetical protein
MSSAGTAACTGQGSREFTLTKAGTAYTVTSMSGDKP